MIRSVVVKIEVPWMLTLRPLAAAAAAALRYTVVHSFGHYRFLPLLVFLSALRPRCLVLAELRAPVLAANSWIRRAVGGCMTRSSRSQRATVFAATPSRSPSWLWVAPKRLRI